MSKPSREAHLAEFQERLSLALKHRQADENERARADLLQALAYAEEHLGAESPEVDRACFELACFHADLEEPDAELAMLERRLRIRRAVRDVPEVVDALQDLAQAHANHRHPEDAERTYAEAVALCDPELETHRSPLRVTLLFLGNFLFDHDRAREAAEAYERGLRVCARSTPYPSHTAARLAMHLAEALFPLDRKAEAVELLEQALPVMSHSAQRPMSATGKLYYFLANHYQNEDRLEEAARTYDLAILTSVAVSRPSQRNLAYIRQAQASNDLKRQKPARAERNLRLGVKHALRRFEPHHADVLSIQQDLVNLFIPAGRYADAEQVLEEMTKAAAHPEFTDDRAKERYHNNLGFVQVHLEEFPKAEANLRRALAFTGPDEGCYVIKNFGLMYQKMGYVAEAIREYRKALPLFERHFGADHSVAAFIRGALAELEGPTT